MNGPLANAARGALLGAVSTVALTGLRQAMARVGLVHQSAPEQVVMRLEELGLLDDRSQGFRRSLAVVAHFAYGAGVGGAFGLLRGDARAEPRISGESAVGSALGVLSWGAGWTTLLPLLGVHRPPWSQKGPRVLLPVLDHAFFGAVWGLLRGALRR